MSTADASAADVLSVILTWGPTLALAVALAASAGLRAWLPLLATGTLAKLGVLQLGESFGFLSSTPALVLFGVATVLELVGDKVPAVDHALDAVSTFTRPVAGILLTASVVWQLDPLWAVAIGVVVGAPVAAAPHVAKSALRVASTATTGGLANPFVSFAEDVAALALIVLAFLLPVLTLALLVVCAVLIVRTVRTRRRASAAVAAAAAVAGRPVM